MLPLSEDTEAADPIVTSVWGWIMAEEERGPVPGVYNEAQAANAGVPLTKGEVRRLGELPPGTLVIFQSTRPQTYIVVGPVSNGCMLIEDGVGNPFWPSASQLAVVTHTPLDAARDGFLTMVDEGYIK